MNKDLANAIAALESERDKPYLKHPAPGLLDGVSKFLGRFLQDKDDFEFKIYYVIGADVEDGNLRYRVKVFRPMSEAFEVGYQVMYQSAFEQMVLIDREDAQKKIFNIMRMWWCWQISVIMYIETGVFPKSDMFCNGGLAFSAPDGVSHIRSNSTYGRGSSIACILYETAHMGVHVYNMLVREHAFFKNPYFMRRFRYLWGKLSVEAAYNGYPLCNAGEEVAELDKAMMLR